MIADVGATSTPDFVPVVIDMLAVLPTPTPGGAVASETCTGYCTTLLVTVLCGVICVTVPVAVAFVAGNVMRAAWPSCTFAASASAMLAVTASSLGLAITMKPLPEDVAAVFVDASSCRCCR